MQRYHCYVSTWRLHSLLLVIAASAHAWPVFANTADMHECIDQAAQRYRVDARLIRAIIQVESSGNPSALNRNTNGSEDIGLMQINSSWLPVLGRHGIKRHHLYDPCTNVHIGAWVLAGNIVRYGPTWRAVGAYNARSHMKRKSYVAKVWRQFRASMEAES